MAEPTLDRIHIRDLLVRCILGIYDEERRDKQDVIINITLHADLHVACASDRIEDTANYKDIKKKVLAMVQDSQYYLVERLAEHVAELALDAPLIERVDVTVEKPGALRFARSVAIEITRTKESR
ncbi:MAG: dihydroneopterin aldolase [Candidatus Hydrogenedentes bacterium]|nr:dihydroneopterin aldolase [Candidatus Hydrogenedentota bacterium]